MNLFRSLPSNRFSYPLSRAVRISQRRNLSSSSAKAAVSSDSSHGGPSEGGRHTAEDFSSPIWRRALIGSIGAFMLYRINEMYTDQKEEKGEVHPITAYIGYYMTPESEVKEKNYTAIKNIEKAASDTLLLQELDGGKPPKIVAPELLDRASPFLVSAGTQVDFAGVEMKN